MTEKHTHHDRSPSHENIPIHPPLVGLQARLLLGGDALDPNNTDLPEVTADGLSNRHLRDTTTYKYLAQASTEERARYWSEKNIAPSEQKAQWIQDTVKSFRDGKAYFDQENWHTIFSRLGINSKDFTEAAAEKLYENYVNRETKQSETKKFITNILNTYSSTQDLERDMAGIEWFANIFGETGAQAVAQLTHAEARNILKIEQDKLINEANEQSNGYSRVNRLEDKETKILTYFNAPPVATTPQPPTPPQDLTPAIISTLAPRSQRTSFPAPRRLVGTVAEESFEIERAINRRNHVLPAPITARRPQPPTEQPTTISLPEVLTKIPLQVTMKDIITANQNAVGFDKTNEGITPEIAGFFINQANQLTPAVVRAHFERRPIDFLFANPDAFHRSESDVRHSIRFAQSRLTTRQVEGWLTSSPNRLKILEVSSRMFVPKVREFPAENRFSDEVYAFLEKHAQSITKEEIIAHLQTNPLDALKYDYRLLETPGLFSDEVKAAIIDTLKQLDQQRDTIETYLRENPQNLFKFDWFSITHQKTSVSPAVRERIVQIAKAFDLIPPNFPPPPSIPPPRPPSPPPLPTPTTEPISSPPEGEENRNSIGLANVVTELTANEASAQAHPNVSTEEEMLRAQIEMLQRDGERSQRRNRRVNNEAGDQAREKRDALDET